MKAQLKFLNGDRAGEVFNLREGRTVIGRQVGDIALSDREVSSIHAIISYERNTWFVMDLGSTNGVYVNNQLTPESELRDGVEIRLGQSRMLFMGGKGEGEPAATSSEVSYEGGEEATTDIPGLSLGPAATETVELTNQPEPAPEPMVARRPLDEEIQFGGALQESTGEHKGLSSFEVILEVVEGADRGLVYRFNSETILLGRLNTDLVVRDSDVSRRHAIVEVFEDNLVYIRDLGSTNGTFVNGQRISTAKLKTSDQIKLGRCTLSFDYKIVQ